jgi:hypothetical protein
MEEMPSVFTIRLIRSHRWSLGSLLMIFLAMSGCKSAQKADTQQQDQADMWLNTVPELKPLNVSNAEIGELQKAHDAGLTDPTAVALIKLARDRQKPFVDGESIANLLSAGSSEHTVFELARLNQLGLWAGEAQALRLSGQSDQTILAIAQRRSKGLAVPTGVELGEMKNAGLSDATILDFVQRGLSQKDISAYIAQKERAAGGHGFVYQGGHKKQG